MQNLTAALLIAGGLTLLASLTRHAAHPALAPVRAFLATVLVVIGVSWIIRGPTRPFHGPILVVLVLIGVSYGAVAAGATLAFPAQTPKAVQGIVGAFCVIAGALLLLFAFRVINPR